MVALARTVQSAASSTGSLPQESLKRPSSLLLDIASSRCLDGRSKQRRVKFYGPMFPEAFAARRVEQRHVDMRWLSVHRALFCNVTSQETQYFHVKSQAWLGSETIKTQDTLCFRLSLHERLSFLCLVLFLHRLRLTELGKDVPGSIVQEVLRSIIEQCFRLSFTFSRRTGLDNSFLHSKRTNTPWICLSCGRTRTEDQLPRPRPTS